MVATYLQAADREVDGEKKPVKTYDVDRNDANSEHGTTAIAPPARPGPHAGATPEDVTMPLGTDTGKGDHRGRLLHFLLSLF
jgi:hypothetical protein